MKATFLSVCAVLLGLAAGFAAAIAVNPDFWTTKKREVLVAKKGIDPNMKVNVEIHLEKRSVPDSYIPPDAIDASNDWLIDGLETNKEVLKDGYILYSDLELEPLPQKNPSPSNKSN